MIKIFLLKTLEVNSRVFNFIKKYQESKIPDIFYFSTFANFEIETSYATFFSMSPFSNFFS